MCLSGELRWNLPPFFSFLASLSEKLLLLLLLLLFFSCGKEVLELESLCSFLHTGSKIEKAKLLHLIPVELLIPVKFNP
jgi:hypothetical protein